MKRGFTLIELLVVIAIIGILSSVVMASLNTARAKARDARRISDLNQIRTALELYYNDKGYYPPSWSCGYDCNGYTYSYIPASWNALATELGPYIKTLPVDPLNAPGCPPWGEDCFTYVYGNVGRSTYQAQYDLAAQLEDTNHPQRCALKQYRYYFDDYYPWCGPYSYEIYEASAN